MKYSYWLGCCLGLLLLGCQKEALLPPPTGTEIGLGQPHRNVFNNGQLAGVRSHSGDSLRTQLGAQRQNPYTTTQVAAAHRSLYGSSLTAMNPTHFYVQFEPQSLDDIRRLEATDETFYDFPLDYEVIQLGEYYQELGPEDFPIWYAVVPAGFDYPEVDYQVLADLYLDQSDPLLIAESFRLTGQAGLIHSDIPGATGQRPGDLPDGGTAPVPGEPECPPGYVAELQIDDSTIPVRWIWVCVKQHIDGPLLNSCGCPRYSSMRKPAGCVKVDDTQLSTPNNPSTFEPVRRVRIAIRDSWFTEDVTWTDDNGCWRVNKEYKGRAWMWIKFSNGRAKIRGTTNDWRTVYEWATTIKDYVGVLWGPDFNNIEVNYGRWTEQGSSAQVYWGAATVNNAIHEFHDYAAQDGISRPPEGLDVYVGRNHRFGYAFMPSFMGAQLTNYALGTGLTGNTSFIQPFAVLLSVTSPVGIVNQFFPDMFVGVDYTESDQLKSLAYHEIAHTSHYMLVGPDYWSKLVAAEVAADGHGNQFSNDAGRIAVCESWAEYLGGLHYVHRTYGGDNSINGNWEIRLEETWNEVPNHIPVGLHHDLIDTGEPTFSVNGTIVSACNQRSNNCALIDDRVSGFTNSQLFQAVNRQVVTIPQYRQWLVAQVGVNGNTLEELEALFGSY